MRIVAGAYRGRRLKVAAGNLTRPTTERVREAIFNVLASRVENASVLDLYAGSGALGLEALSRGARRAVFVEAAVQAANVIRDNMGMLTDAHRTHATLLQRPIDRCVTRLRELGPFDLALIDPPFAAVRDGSCMPTLERVAAGGVMKPDALWVLEFPDDQPDPKSEWLDVQQVRHYGDTRVAFMVLRGEVPKPLRISMQTT